MARSVKYFGESDGGEYLVDAKPINLAAIESCPWNARRIDDDDPAIAELAKSIAVNGLISPITVRPKEGFYEILAGERRVAACRRLGRKEIDCIVRDLDDAAARVLTVTENMQRRDLTPLEEALGVKTLLDQPGWDYEQVAAQLGKSASWVARRAQLTRLSEHWIEEIDNTGLFAGWPVAHFELIARYSPSTQNAVLGELLDHQWNIAGLRRPALENLLEAQTGTLGQARWKKEDADLVPAAGACTSCPKRASQAPLLFDLEGGAGDIKKDRCLDRDCWEAKEQAYVARRAEELGAKYDNLVFCADRQSEIYPAAISTRQRQPCKQNDPQARPTLVVNGDDAGKLSWTKPYNDGLSKPAGNPRPQGPDGKPAPKKLSEKRAELLARRRALALSYLQDEITDTAVEAGGLTSGVALRLAAIFGTEGINLPNKPDWVADEFERLSEAETLEPYKELWQHVIPRVNQWLTCGLAPSTNQDAFAKFWSRGTWLAGIIGVDADELMARAEKELPEPKSWQANSEVSAGTRGQSEARTKAAGKRAKRSSDLPSKSKATSKAKPKKAAVDRKAAAAGME